VAALLLLLVQHVLHAKTGLALGLGHEGHGCTIHAGHRVDEARGLLLLLHSS